MEELKVKLFAETLHYFCALRAYSNVTHGDEEWDVTHGKFCVLYGLIESSGLDAEYQEWKKRILEGEGGETCEVE